MAPKSSAASNGFWRNRSAPAWRARGSLNLGSRALTTMIGTSIRSGSDFSLFITINQSPPGKPRSRTIRSGFPLRAKPIAEIASVATSRSYPCLFKRTAMARTISGSSSTINILFGIEVGSPLDRFNFQQFFEAGGNRLHLLLKRPIIFNRIEVQGLTGYAAGYPCQLQVHAKR